MDESQKIDVINYKDAIQIIGCTQTVFYTRHRKNLTVIPTDGKEKYYSLKQVSEYAANLKKAKELLNKVVLA